MKYHCLVIVFLNCCIFSLTVTAQKTEVVPIDTIIANLEKDVQNAYASNNFQELYEACYTTLKRAEETQNLFHIAKVHSIIAYWHMLKELPAASDSMLYHDLRSLEYLLQTADQKQIAQTYLYIANDYTDTNTNESQKYIFKGLQISEALGDKSGMADAYARLATLNIRTANYEESTYYSEQAIALFRELEEPIGLAQALLFSVEAYNKLNRLEEGFRNANESVALIEEHHPDALTLLMRAYAWRASNHKAAGRYELGLKDAFHSWDICKEVVADDRDADGYKEEIGAILYAQGKYEEALPYYEDFVAHCYRRDGVTSRFVSLYQEMVKCYTEMGQYENALDYQMRAMSLSDSLKDNRYATLEAELQIKYETEKKEQLITQQSKERAYIFGFLGLLTVVSLLLFRAYRKQNKLNLELQTTNAQNELLLKEIHHRVKNNLQTISSLLSLQSAHIDDQIAQEAVQKSQSRVGSMALIHQKLYQGENLAAIEMKNYLQVLGESIIDSFGLDTSKVDIDYPMEQLELDVDTAIPLGLIANELLTNSLKYAFPSNEKGKILVSLVKTGEKALRFIVKDDGIGITENKAVGFGSQLVYLLVKQLDGSITTTGTSGMSTEIQFQL